MLRDFSFSNFRSYRDDQAFTMTRPTSAVKNEPEDWAVPDVSCVSAVYGSNASGKTAFCEALPALAGFVVRGFADGEEVSSVALPFLLDVDSRETPTSFSVDFVAGGRRYVYDIDVIGKAVSYEALQVHNAETNRLRRVFVRELGDDGTYSFLYGEELKGPKKAAESVSVANAPFLSTLHRTRPDQKAVNDAYGFFAGQVVFLDAGSYEAELRVMRGRLGEDAPYTAAITEVMSQADLGISVVESESILDKLRTKDKEAFDMLTEGTLAIIDPNITPEERRERAKELRSSPLDPARRLVFTHKGADGYKGSFDEDDESEGTLAMLAFFSAALDLLSRPTVAFVDEIDKSLHPIYVEEMIKLYRDPATNPHQSQLIFTTHDVSLINKSGADERVLDQDQVWFTEKGPDGASGIFPATALGTRREENFGKNYLHGVYGAVPVPDFHGAFARVLGKARA